MRITFLLTQSIESPSGLGRYLPIAKELVRMGHQVTVLALHPDYDHCRVHRFTLGGVQVRYAAQMHVRKAGHGKSYFGTPDLLRVSAWATIKLSALAVRLPCDVLHLCKPQPINGIAALLGVRGRRARRLYVDCDDYEAASNRFSADWQRRVVAFFEDRLPLQAAGLTVNTPFLQDRYSSLGIPAGRIVCVPNGVDRERFAGDWQEEAAGLRRSLELDSRPVVLYAGSLSLSSHPVELLLNAFAQVVRRHPAAVLVLAGGGEDYAQLRRLAAELGLGEAVRFVGRISPSTMPGYYHMADLSVEPVKDDAAGRARSPLKVVESLAAGTPVVSGDVGDRRTMLDGGRAGLLVKPGDPSALANGLIELIGSPDRRHAMALAAAEIRERYYWDVLAKDFARVYTY